MFISLLVVTFLIALLVSTVVALVFRPALKRILERILSDAIYTAWLRYLLFALFVVGVSSGVRIWELERYIGSGPRLSEGMAPPVLDSDHWVLEVYRTIIGTLEGIAWVLLVFFVFALIGFVVVRLGERRQQR